MVWSTKAILLKNIIKIDFSFFLSLVSHSADIFPNVVVVVLDMDGTSDTPYALDYSESMAFFNSAYNPTSAQSITATEFDSAQELLWAGSNEVLPCDEKKKKNDT